MTTMAKQQTELEKLISEGKVVLIEASKLSLDDEFMKYRPKTDEEKAFKKLLSEVIKSGVKDFYRPVLDPSFNSEAIRSGLMDFYRTDLDQLFNDDNSSICYEFGRRPAVGKTYRWWEEKAREFNSNSRVGTRYEYTAFLGILIKKLVESGWSVSEAWNAVCTDSKELGHYWNSDNAKYDFEDTGLREVCGFYDLANTYKILAEDKEGGYLWLAGGSFSNISSNYSLANLNHFNNFYCFRGNDIDSSVGWLVIECETDPR